MSRHILPFLLLLPWAGCTTPLMKAARRNQLQTVKTLLDQGADVNESAEGLTALLYAAAEGRAEVAKVLVERGAKVNHPAAATGKTPLMLAALVGELETARVLLDHGADSELKDKSGKTAEMIAEGNGHPEIARMIREGAAKQEEKAKAQAAQALLDSKMPAIRASTAAGDRAGAAGDYPEALKHYMAALGEVPPGVELEGELRGKIIRFALALKKAPPIPEEARRFAIRGQAIVKSAKTAKDFADAAAELAKAVRAAPWWPEAYFNLALVQEKAGRLGLAMANLKFYLAAKPGAKDAAAVERKIIELEVAQERK